MSGSRSRARVQVAWQSASSSYAGDIADAAPNDEDLLAQQLKAGQLSAAELLGRYCALLYRRLGTYAEVSKRTGLDPRTTRKYVQAGAGVKVRT
jgi:hypothetical protein